MPFPRSVLTCAALILLASCAAPPFRITSVTDPLCADPHALGPANREIQDAARHACGLQPHVLPTENVPPPPDEEMTEDGGLRHFEMAMNAWTQAAAAMDPPRDLKQSDRYTLAFLELTAKAAYAVPTQRPELRAHLAEQARQGRQNIVVTYVHGWRHDAAIRDGDAVKFRRVLGYTRAALNARCIERGTYCDAALTGVFVGWPGRVINEGFTDDNPNRGVGFRVGSLSALASFWDRYNLSCRLGTGSNCHPAPTAAPDAPLRRVLNDVQAGLRPLRPGAADADKLLIFGHSLGGNMLATMLRAETERRVSRHAPGGPFRPLLGDLVVLINPASSAHNWTGIQRAERRRAGLGDTNVLSCFRQGPDCFDRHFRNLRRWSGLYPVTQRPVYVSLTSSANWGTLVNRDNPDYDTATDRVFRLAQQAANRDAREEKVTIGHLMPRYADRHSLRDGADPVGATHEMAVLESAGGVGNTVLSTYANATRPEAAWCAPSDGWLRMVRTPRAGDPRPYVTDWDYGLVPRLPDGTAQPSRNVGGLQNRASIRWRQSVRFNRDIDGLSVAPGTTPFWNVRALDTAIRGHAGWANYPTWCAITQLVLDDATAAVPAAAVARVFEALTAPAVPSDPVTD